MKKITIEVIPHAEQRYETVGDWIYSNDNEELTIKVSDMNNWKYNMLVGVHELIEVLLCDARGITQVEVDNFDKEFEEKRVEGNVDEPGDDPAAPYKDEHFFATNIERLLCAELGVDWKTYNDIIENL